MIARSQARFASWATPPLPLYGDDHERRDFAPSALPRVMPAWTPPPLWPPWALQHG
ncbi:hypothetical protein [Paractinoplanes brasiliensis]|uniref:hypothetical protein n=1 Tax=Paractinoplanes brasiliensis TaxID=52695 RepID=UPI00141529E8|nr:hypothetical protein [Actinoplanes brasiliensis]GID28449.1 hypothetical protein Abr02nite_34320 [Actinoplanes brasiliensis]